MDRMGPVPGGTTERVIGCAMRVHRVLGPGFLELVYQNAFAYELEKSGFAVERQRRIPVMYEGQRVGDYIADLLVDGVLIVENKAVERLNRAHEVQLVHYLVATGVDVGLLFNFGASRLEVRRKTRLYPAPRHRTGPIT